MNNIPCIGLFGTCGNSTWRTTFMDQYRNQGIRFFNPQVADWTPECADIEAQHLARDEIILFPVTGETYGSGSLAETGFSILQAIMSNTNRYVVVLIDMNLVDDLKANEVAYKESIRARKLVVAHIKEHNHPNVFLVETLEEMLALSISLNNVLNDLNDINTTYRRRA